MRGVVWLALLVLLAGCFGDSSSNSDDADSEGHADSDPHAPGGHEGDEPDGDAANRTVSPPANAAPMAVLTVNVTGEGPFLATFDVNVSDADGDAVTWKLDANGDGEADEQGLGSLTGIEYEYNEAGNYTAILEATDGFDTTTSNLTVELVGAAVEPFVGEGVAIAPCPQCRDAGANTGVGYRAGESGVDSVFIDIPPQYIGKAFVATASAGDVDLAFRDACAGGGNGGGLVGEASVGDGDPEGEVPAGTVCVLMWNYDTPETTLTITIG